MKNRARCEESLSKDMFIISINYFGSQLKDFEGDLEGFNNESQQLLI